MDCQRSCARSLKQLSEFKFEYLSHTQFGKAFGQLKKYNESKAFQSLELIQSVQKEIYEDLIETKKQHEARAEECSFDGKQSIKTMKEEEDELLTQKDQYFKSREELEMAIQHYDGYKHRPDLDENY